MKLLVRLLTFKPSAVWFASGVLLAIYGIIIDQPHFYEVFMFHLVLSYLARIREKIGDL